MAGGRDRRLDDEEVTAGILGDPAKALSALGDGADDGRDTAPFDLTDAFRDQLFPDRLLINGLDKAGGLGRRGRRDFLEHHFGIVIAGLDPFQIQDGDSSQLAHARGKAGIHHPVHGRGKDRDRVDFPADLPSDVDLIRIDRHAAGHQGDLIKPIGSPCLAISSDPLTH